MYSCIGLAFLLLLGCGVLQSDATVAEVLDQNNKTCIYAEMMVNFTVQYETSNSTLSTAEFVLPTNVTTAGSICGNKTVTPFLKISFGNGHYWSINFTHSNTSYHGDVFIFGYNVSDSTIFHNASQKGVIKVVANDTMPPVPMDHYYRCMSDDVFKQGNVTQTFWNVSIQAYIKDGNLSENATVCSADTPTTVAPVTNITTIAPVTNVTTAAPTTTPKPTPTPKPDKETYKVSRGNDTCLIITMGLQLNYSTSAQAPWEVKNIDPNVTTASGTCGNDTSTITLNENNTIYLVFSFAKHSSKTFYLKGVNVTTIVNGSAQQLGINNNLSYWEATLGSSYMCNKDQVFKVTDKLFINTYDLRVQPFNVTNGEYSTGYFAFPVGLFKYKTCLCWNPQMNIPVCISQLQDIQRFYNFISVLKDALNKSCKSFTCIQTNCFEMNHNNNKNMHIAK
ncbi:lysosome-associated membrane glycoprotein 2-like isoform X1 [Acipenser ruthenus]|uniref:lysosome-associated membrane glycoprotein 2-like isoform X1 n=1 Tax=Acipenser ruthenus TaxID=7906 RepID=UPI0027405ABE|nr:lysosome-associated membrane glycoprotein 2-like isoform X1 [Acipenser ruthenus]